MNVSQLHTATAIAGPAIVAPVAIEFVTVDMVQSQRLPPVPALAVPWPHVVCRFCRSFKPTGMQRLSWSEWPHAEVAGLFQTVTGEVVSAPCRECARVAQVYIYDISHSCRTPTV